MDGCNNDDADRDQQFESKRIDGRTSAPASFVRMLNGCDKSVKQIVELEVDKQS
jgi:hypothetical protein